MEIDVEEDLAEMDMSDLSLDEFDIAEPGVTELDMEPLGVNASLADEGTWTLTSRYPRRKKKRKRKKSLNLDVDME